MPKINPFIVFILKRLGIMVLSFFVASTIMFLLPRIIPGNPLAVKVYQILQQSASNPEMIKSVEKMLMDYFKLDRPLYEQYFDFLINLLHGDLGKSITYFPRTVNEIVAMYLPWTLALLVPAIIASWIVGNYVGVIAAMNRGKAVDKVLLPLLAALQGTPAYVFGMYLVLLAVATKWFPASGAYSPTAIPSLSWSFIVDYLHHYILPFLSIFLTSLGGWGLSMRNIAIQELSMDYMDYARVIGISPRKTQSYLFRLSALPQIVGLAIVLGWSVAGSIITEIIFAYPGIGTALWSAIQAQDYMLIQGYFVILIGTILLANFISEIIFAVVDPRVRYAYAGE
ncbi:MAG: ABC transporter permease [Ignisphaera sp.]